MADQKTIEKVKELLETNAYAPLKEAAEKWLAVADEKYDVKEKAGKAWDKINDAADAFADASGKFNEKMGGVSEKVADAAGKIQEKSGPALEKIKEAADPLIDKAQDAVKDAAGKLADKTDIDEKVKAAAGKVADADLIKQLKESISTFSENIELFGSEKGAEIVGSKEAAEQLKKHAEAMKAEGKTYCDCPACTKAREILKELGEDIGE